MRQYQQQSVTSSSPQQLVVKLYDIGIAACHAGDRKRVRSVLVELIGSLNFQDGGDIATRLHGLYEFCLNESGEGDLDVVCDLLVNLRDAWKEVAKTRPKSILK
jgi:flagellar protein FliS